MNKKFKGFTLIELLVVVAIIGTLASVGIYSYNGYVKSSKKSSAKNTMMQIGLAQTEFYSNSGFYWSNEFAGGTCSATGDDGETALVGKGLFGKEKYIDPARQKIHAILKTHIHKTIHLHHDHQYLQKSPFP